MKPLVHFYTAMVVLCEDIATYAQNGKTLFPATIRNASQYNAFEFFPLRRNKCSNLAKQMAFG